MPALHVTVDGDAVATVCVDGYDSVSARVSGSRIDDELARLEVAGGRYPNGGESTYLTWVDSLALKPGQVVLVSFVKSAQTSHAGKTIEELSLGEELPEVTNFKPTAQMIAELRDTPLLREYFSLRLESSIGKTFVGTTGKDDHGFGFSVHWTSFHPERARVALHSYTLEQLEKRGPMNDYIEERIYVGDWVRFALDA